MAPPPEWSRSRKPDAGRRMALEGVSEHRAAGGTAGPPRNLILDSYVWSPLRLLPPSFMRGKQLFSPKVRQRTVAVMLWLASSRTGIVHGCGTLLAEQSWGGALRDALRDAHAERVPGPAQPPGAVRAPGVGKLSGNRKSAAALALASLQPSTVSPSPARRLWRQEHAKPGTRPSEERSSWGSIEI